MKTLLVVLVSLMLGLTIQAQTFTEKTSSGAFNTESGTLTQDNITVEGKTFDVYVTSKGSKYVKAISAKGSQYPVWIGEPTGKSFEGHPVYQFKSGTYAYFKLTAKGYPNARYLNSSE